MRLPEAKIKEAILHPDIELRDRTARYFARSSTPDPAVMPLLIKAVETYGRQNDAYMLIGSSRDLQQSEDTIAWVIDELNDESCGKHENYAYNLSMVLVEADSVAETKGARLNVARLSSRPPSLRIGTKAINPLFHSYAFCSYFRFAQAG